MVRELRRSAPALSRIALAALLAVALAGCESDAEKLNRLQTQAAMARLSVVAAEQAIDDKRRELGPYLPIYPDRSSTTDLLEDDYWALVDSLDARRDRVLLAERELNRFLGR